jgi:hypothetical protein
LVWARVGQQGIRWKVHQGESEAAVTEYVRKSGVPFVNVQVSMYASNFTNFFKQADGSYVLALPINPSALAPIIDMAEDYGMFVREAIESPEFGPGTEILACGELISYSDSISQLAESTSVLIFSEGGC